MHTTGTGKVVSAEAEMENNGEVRTEPIEGNGRCTKFRQSQREIVPNYTQKKSQNNNPNFGRAVERERSELRNASPKERKSQVWKPQAWK